MNLKILSTIAAISATTTYASSLTCGDVKSLYQDGACCAANDQSCVKTLSIAADSSGFTTLSNTGELSIDLSGKADQTTVSELQIIVGTKADQTDLVSGLALKADQTDLVSGLALKADQTDLVSGLALKADQTALTEYDTATVAANKVAAALTEYDTATVAANKVAAALTEYDTTIVLEGKLADKADLTALTEYDTATVAANKVAAALTEYDTTIVLEGKLAGKLDKSTISSSYIPWGIGANQVMEAVSNQYRPLNHETYCSNPTDDSNHGFKSVWASSWSNGGGWEMHLQAGKLAPNSWPCIVRQIDFGDSQLFTNGEVYASGNLVTSDSRIKKDIVDADIEDALQKVRDIELKEYGYTNPEKAGEKTVGFIAQQVKEVYPDAIKIDTRENTVFNEAGEMVEIPDLHRVKKDKIFALHHGAIQSLDAKIAAMEARLAALEPQPTA